jgi:FMN reductase
MRRIVVISAGLSVPSSTRLLADKLGAATERGIRSRTSSSARSRTRWPTTC